MKSPSQLTTAELEPYGREWMRRKRPAQPRAPKLAPCIHCGGSLNATERRKACKFCGGRNPRKLK